MLVQGRCQDRSAGHGRRRLQRPCSVRGRSDRLRRPGLGVAGASDRPGSPGHGGVSFGRHPGGAGTSADLIALPDGGRLTVADADPMRQMVVRIGGWEPAAASPARATVSWVPQPLSFGNAGPDDIRRATVAIGSEINLGGACLTVRALVPAASDHPAWIAFTLSRPG